jgi:hypothetical protein
VFAAIPQWMTARSVRLYVSASPLALVEHPHLVWVEAQPQLPVRVGRESVAQGGELAVVIPLAIHRYRRVTQ